MLADRDCAVTLYILLMLLSLIMTSYCSVFITCYIVKNMFNAFVYAYSVAEI